LGSQIELYQKVMKLGGVQPESVSYVEAYRAGSEYLTLFLFPS
jgi:acyl transferase domain-containing protein